MCHDRAADMASTHEGQEGSLRAAALEWVRGEKRASEKRACHVLFSAEQARQASLNVRKVGHT